MYVNVDKTYEKAMGNEQTNLMQPAEQIYTAGFEDEFGINGGWWPWFSQVGAL